MTALTLAVLAVLLAWPVPVVLGRARWVHRAPAAAMVLWQAVALSGGMAMIGTPLAWGLAPFGDTLQTAAPAALDTTDRDGWLQLLIADDLGPARIAAVTLALILTVHLVLTLGVTAVRTLRERHRHRRLVELLADPDGRSRLDTAPLTRGTRVLPHDAPVAYCLPGLIGGVTVVSRGLLEQLSEAEVGAVVAHERAHVLQRHDLLRLAFDAWNRAFPWLPTTRVAQRAVSSLTEMLADDAALRGHRRADLISAISLTGGSRKGPSEESSSGPVPTRQRTAQPTEDAGGEAVPLTPRLYRLLSPTAPLPVYGRAGIVVASVLLATAPAGLLLTG